MPSPLELMSGNNGTFTVNDTTAKTLNFVAMYFPEDTVISELRENGSANNVISEYVSTPGTGIKATSFKVANPDKWFTYIKLTSGSVELLKKQ